jgi:Zn-finger nucleic acid-binding protein
VSTYLCSPGRGGTAGPYWAYNHCPKCNGYYMGYELHTCPSPMTFSVPAMTEERVREIVREMLGSEKRKKKKPRNPRRA